MDGFQGHTSWGTSRNLGVQRSVTKFRRWQGVGGHDEQAGGQSYPSERPEESLGTNSTVMKLPVTVGSSLINAPDTNAKLPA